MWSTLQTVAAFAVVAMAVADITCPAVETDIDYYGNDLVATDRDNHDDCCADCQSTDRCVAYSWRDGVCYLKHTKGNPEWAPGVVSAALPVQTGRTCGAVERDVDYPGNDLLRTDTPKASGCCALCAENPACKVSVWYNGACYLKHDDSYKVRVVGARAHHVVTDGGYTPTPSPYTTTKPTPTLPPKKGDLGMQVAYQLSVIRQAHGLNAVEYDDAMAKDMQEWADNCYMHPNGGHGGPYGVQNLAPALLCGDNCMAVEGPSWWWYDEIKYWDFNTNKCTEGNEACGHFVNSMGTWVTHVGCGWSNCYNPGIGKYDPLLWCNYRGNGNDRAIPRPQKPLAEIHAAITAAFK
ncbi:hypothetical protein DYB32_006068 [Aphanomyces invadans]|uniref:SCP domain-containing protein n=1 Tax=Aphanomyces invadans TaxID=157072 RepID=A0A418ASS1_9STRA|nr:hypothetical protein DYB32_006068 [Aphanomyces invadans]